DGNSKKPDLFSPCVRPQIPPIASAKNVTNKYDFEIRASSRLMPIALVTFCLHVCLTAASINDPPLFHRDGRTHKFMAGTTIFIAKYEILTRFSKCFCDFLH